MVLFDILKEEENHKVQNQLGGNHGMKNILNKKKNFLCSTNFK